MIGCYFFKLSFHILFIYFKKKQLIFGSAGSLLLCRLSFSCGQRGLPLQVRYAGFIVVASRTVKHLARECVGFSSCGYRTPEHRLSSCNARA